MVNRMLKHEVRHVFNHLTEDFCIKTCHRISLLISPQCWIIFQRNKAVLRHFNFTLKLLHGAKNLSWKSRLMIKLYTPLNITLQISRFNDSSGSTTVFFFLGRRNISFFLLLKMVSVQGENSKYEIPSHSTRRVNNNIHYSVYLFFIYEVSFFFLQILS